MPVKADCGNLIKEIILLKPSIKKCATWLDYCSRVNEKYPVVLPEYRKKKKYVSTYVLAEEISRSMKDGEIFVPGSSGMCSGIFPCRYLNLKKASDP